jgi:hypothetical protein
MFTHKVHYLRRYGGGGGNKITLIFPVFIIDHNHNFPVFDIFDRLVDAVKHSVTFYKGKTFGRHEKFDGGAAQLYKLVSI